MSGAAAVRDRRRAGLAWAGIVAGVVAVGAVAAAILGIGTMPATGLLDPEAAGADGSRAAVEILRERGVEVTVARDRASVLSALRSGDATLAIADTAPLDDADLAEITDAAASVVLLQPRSRDLRMLLDGASPAGFASASAPDAACDLAIAGAGGDITAGEVFAPGPAATGCYPSGDGFALVAIEDGDRSVVAVDATAIATNATLADGGNAALTVNTLGATGSVVWYLPSLGDGSLPLAPTLGELTPRWVTPAILLLIGTALVAAIWRGRRFGPLVAENLPVTVRASETTEGRARLYARAADPVHALDQLRRLSLRRCGRLLGLGSDADAGAIADAVAVRLDADRTGVRGILLDDLPNTDRDLVDAADRLRDLEDRLRTTVRPERTSE